MKNYLVFSMAALLVGASCNTKQEKAAEGFTGAVSYTHLTLPTIA